MKLLRIVGLAILLEVVAIGVFWGALRVAGTSKALPFAAMALLLLLAVDFGAGKAKQR